MGVLSVGDDLPVWGGGRRIIYSIIEYAIGTIGERPYLNTLKESFDHGYNHADLGALTRYELSEFRDAAASYARNIQWKREGLKDCEELMRGLLDLVEVRLTQLTTH
ncbi:hypothetical protein [Mesorhizobium sp. NZP2077]|uniref:hypothetical protein n=1 Tax=Mesorhizobium sp. NZP2077 TaxID=2483404 RepID=UPI0015522A31|nr:hypothetical protein [Mesorhizobium sp. NZP2077]QKC83050.1 hypothetical protein EB232_16850 [Mesorhizobium sp. NZP2077]QKD16558.1 hypothetical protein HGP13_16630 [Mesorhizobium sp. NZP2077]